MRDEETAFAPSKLMQNSFDFSKNANLNKTMPAPATTTTLKSNPGTRPTTSIKK